MAMDRLSTCVKMKKIVQETCVWWLATGKQEGFGCYFFWNSLLCTWIEDGRNAATALFGIDGRMEIKTGDMRIRLGGVWSASCWDHAYTGRQGNAQRCVEADTTQGGTWLQSDNFGWVGLAV